MATASSLDDVPRAAQTKIMAHMKEAGVLKNGWRSTQQTGSYGTDYLQRALVTAIGLGANLPEDAMYPMSETDADGKSYDGANKYVMHFAKGQTPPVNGFWSLTMYDDKFFFVPNSIDRYNVSSRSPFKRNPDGSLIFIYKQIHQAKIKKLIGYQHLMANLY